MANTFKIPTEIVVLPSKGLLYPEDSPLSKGEIEMKYMTSKEEEKYDPALSEYPSALIAFDQKKKEFTYDKNYTKSYFEEIKTTEN